MTEESLFHLMPYTILREERQDDNDGRYLWNLMLDYGFHSRDCRDRNSDTVNIT